MQTLFLSCACTTFFILIYSNTQSAQYIPHYLTAKELSLFEKPPVNTIIVWVHGTRFITNHGFKSIFNEKSQLKNGLELSQVRYYRKIIDTLSCTYELPKDNFYFFGWNGKLSKKERKRCASHLYDSLVTLKKQYEKKHHISPTFIALGHSHGGNVILHMAAYHKEITPISLDKVILLACPAQDSMYHYLGSSLFKKIYVLYSHGDMIQTLAPNFLKNEKFSLKNIKLLPFSKRLFPAQDKLVQARVIINGYGPTHNAFVKPTFLALLPPLVHAMDHWEPNDDHIRYIAHLSTEES